MNEKIDIDVKTLRPFTRFIYTIGELPTSYLMSMTYEEQLIWLCNYLKETVIPTVNNNAEAVKEVQDIVMELQDYINNYFDNLDVQEEINNKLDDMAEQGILQEIIASYLNTKAVFGFDSVADMISADNLIDGSYARTLGYRNINDNGGALYFIRTITNEDIIDGANIIAMNDVTLVAILQKENIMNVKCWGAYGDDVHDDTVAIQLAIDSYKDLFISDGTYLIDASTGIYPKTNTHLHLSNNATLKCIPNNLSSYHIVYITKDVDNTVENVIIEGGNIIGDKLVHTGETGEFGHGIYIGGNSKNITLKNITIKNCWGDGIYIGKGDSITTENIVCDNNRRQGMSIISVKNYHSINDKFINTNGTSPEAGVDIEPNSVEDYLNNIIFDNPYTSNNNGGGIKIDIGSPNNPVNIIINNHYDDGSNSGLYVHKGYQSKGNIIINNPYYINSKTAGINLRNCYNSNCKVVLNRPHIENCNTAELSPTYLACISIFTTSGTEANYPLGNIEIIEPYLSRYNTSDSLYGIYIGDQAHSNASQNIDIKNIIYLQSNLRVGGMTCENLLIEDKYHKLHSDRNSSYNIGSGDLWASIGNSTYTSTRLITFLDSFPIGNEITFTRNNPSYNLDFILPSNTYCYPLTTNANPRIRLANGSSITIKRISSTVFVATNIVGSFNEVT